MPYDVGESESTAGPEILGNAIEGNATLIARPEALLKFGETQERNARAGASVDNAGRRRAPAEAGGYAQPDARLNRRRGGIKKIFFCAGGADDEPRNWAEVDDCAETHDHVQPARVPWSAELQCYILSCIEHLENAGDEEPRLFAVSGSQEVIDSMRMEYGSPLPADTDVHVACAVLKQAVRDAETPLVDPEALHRWMTAAVKQRPPQPTPKSALGGDTGGSAAATRNAGTEAENKLLADSQGMKPFRESNLYQTIKLVRDKSPRRAYVLARLVRLLGDITSRVQVTQMNSHNLALCLAPSLLQWDPYAEGALLILGRMTAFVMELIDDGRKHAEKLYNLCSELEAHAALPATRSQLERENHSANVQSRA